MMIEIPKTSRASVIAEYNKPYEVREYPIPEIEPMSILVKVEMAGVCGTDVHQWQGKIGVRPQLPIVPGHEVVGKIVKMGAGRNTDVAGEPLGIGDRIMWPHVSCGKCYSCAINNQPNLCERRFGYGFSHVGDYPYLTGSFAEYEYVVPNADVVKVPDELLNEEVVGASCAFRTAVSAFERLGALGIQSSVVIQGCGPVGLYATLLAYEGGASQVIVVGAPALRLDLAKKWGAKHVINIDEIPDAANRKAEILKLTNGRGPDIVVEASGAPIAFREGMDIVRRGGRYLIIGQSSMEAEQSIIPGLFMLKHLEVIGNGSASISHFYKAIQFIKNNRHKYNFADIITNKYSLYQVNEAINAMKAGKEIKPVIVP
ncbi:MAG: zinc-binding dehydrogenase [Methyloversatilis sp.]|jgi:threonine dehydrogenase-like Zn-dependent dehydrogenase|nr:zinc-binding dehydrogenase [Methyloversatilis sp.]